MRKLTNSVLTFTKNDPNRVIGYEKSKKYFSLVKNKKTQDENGVSIEVMDEDMLNFVKDEIKLMTGKDADNFSSPQLFAQLPDVQKVFWAVISEIIDVNMPDALFRDYGNIADIKSGAYGDTFEYKLKSRDLFTVSKVGESKRQFDIQRKYKAVKTILPEWRALTVGVELEEILTGKATIGELLVDVNRSMDYELNRDIYGAFNTAMGELLASADPNLTATGYDQDTLIHIAETVQAWNGGANTVIMGSPLAVSKVLPQSTSFETSLNIGQDSEYLRLGHLREFYGYPVISMKQIADLRNEFDLLLDDKMLYIVSTDDKFIKVALSGGTRSNTQDNYDSANLQVTSTMWKSWGVDLIASSVAGVMKLA